METILFAVPKAYEKNRMFDIADERLNRDGILRPMHEVRAKLREKGFEVDTLDAKAEIGEARAVVFFDVPKAGDANLARCIKAGLSDRLYLSLWEPPSTSPDNYIAANHAQFKRVLTWDDTLVDGKKYLKFNYAMPYYQNEKIELPEMQFEKKKLLCMITSNKYSPYPTQLYAERGKIIRFMEKSHPGEFDLYGQMWDLPVLHSNVAEMAGLNNIAKLMAKFPQLSPSRIRPNWLYPSWRGSVRDKREVNSKYRFSIAYENVRGLQGYISEKIMDAFLGGNVPVYLGAENISDYVPKNCFVDAREFDSYEKLYSHIRGIGKGEHEEMLAGIAGYLKSPASRQFKIDALAESFFALLGIGAG